MTIEVTFWGYPSWQNEGYVQVNPYAYEYTGDDDDLHDYFEKLDAADPLFASPIDEGGIPDDASMGEYREIQNIIAHLRNSESIAVYFTPDGIDL